jgi:RNase H-fold protein (predicted Holliday junction resolvase)
MKKEKYLMGIDPGRDKCGIAVMDDRAKVYLHQVIDADQTLATVNTVLTEYPIDTLVIGNQTSSKQWQAKLRHQFPNLSIAPVDEKFTSQLARLRYWQMYPPKGWQRLIPVGMRIPPCPIDHIVAIILIERFLSLSAQ